MHAQLFIPCLVEDCQPEAAEAAARVLERLGVELRLPPGQTCCGQLAYKAGDLAGARSLARRYLDVFDAPEPVVCPSGSCTKMLRIYPELFAQGTPERARAEGLAARTFEFCEFVAGLPGAAQLPLKLDARACYHGSCQMPGTPGDRADAPRRLLGLVRGLTVVEAERADRCCGFGGLFSLQFAAVSEALTDDKCREILALEPDMLVSAEPSCLMSLSGRLAKMGRPLRALHVAQVLDAGLRGGL